MLAVQLAKPLSTVRIIGGSSGKSGAEVADIIAQSGAAEQDALIRELEQQKRLYQEVCAALQDAVLKLNQLNDQIFAGHNEAIARLSVEIARKVLMRNVSDGDYEIESIIKEALKSVPESTGMVVRLNPEDLANLQQLQQAGDTSLSGIKLAADAEIGRAECVVESSKGVIKLLIEDHLDQISKALVKTG